MFFPTLQTEELERQGNATSVVETFADVWHDPGKSR